MEGNAGHRVNQSEQRPGKTGAQKGKPPVSGGQSHHRPRKCADGHHALDSDIDNAAALGKAGA